MGADGYTRNYPVAQILGDLKMYQIGAGSSDVLRDLLFRLASKRYGDALDQLPLSVPAAASGGRLQAPGDGSRAGGVLEVLAGFYRLHPGLHMTERDLLRSLGEDELSAGRMSEIQALEEKGKLDVVWAGTRLQLVRATYEGLDDAAGPEAHQPPTVGRSEGAETNDH
jgi:hypothetical protein